jgi:hypothetical protein
MWQPIETAPKLEKLLLTDGLFVVSGSVIGDTGYSPLHFDPERPFTHWMPLPPSPSEARS